MSLCLTAGCQVQSPSTPTIRHGSRAHRMLRNADIRQVAPVPNMLSSGPYRQLDAYRQMQAIGAATQPGGSASAGHPAGNVGESDGSSSGDRTVDMRWASQWLGEDQSRVDQQVLSENYVRLFDTSRFQMTYMAGPVKTYNESGRDYGDGLNIFVSDRILFKYSKHLLLTAEPEFAVNQNARSGRPVAVYGRMRELTAKLRYDPVELTVGKQPMWWGPGRHGALLLSTNAEPFWMAMLAVSQPTTFLAPLDWVGYFDARMFVGVLESDRPVARPMILGQRVSWRPSRYLEVGANHTAMFGGEGVSCNGGDILAAVTGIGVNADGESVNSLASIDFRIVGPFEDFPFEVYGEWGGEDEAKQSGGVPWFSLWAYLVGFHLPRIGPGDLFEFTFEYATTTVRDRRSGGASTKDIWYNSGIYPDGYRYKGDIIGHHVGPDGTDIFAELRMHPAEGWDAYLSYDYEAHHEWDPVEEYLHQLRVGLEYRPDPYWRIFGEVGADYWQNYQQQSGDTRLGVIVTVGGRFEF